MSKYTITTQRGSALIFTLLILTLVTMSALAIASTTTVQRSGSIAASNSTAAFQNADRGMEILLQEIYNELSPLNTLDDLVDQLNSNYGSGWSCDDDTLTKSGESFSIEASPRIGVTIDCSTALADIVSFKIVGEFRQAARALRVTLQESLRRGLVAHWTFEDNAEVERNGGFGAPVARDYTLRYNHILTLCPHDEDNHQRAGFDSQEFETCPRINDENDIDPPDPNFRDVYMDHGSSPNSRGSAWADGVVEEFRDENIFGPQNESLEFNGTSNYLTMNMVNAQNNQENHVVEGSAGLEVNNAFAVSMWVYPTETTPSGEQQILIDNKGDGDDENEYRYRIYIDDDQKPVLSLDRSGGSSRDLEHGDSLNPGRWYHIVAMWDRENDNQRMRLYVNGQGENRSYSGRIDEDFQNVFLGGLYWGDDEGEFAVDRFANGFGGRIDNVRVYDRGLTEAEMLLLCEEADDDVWSHSNCGNFSR